MSDNLIEIINNDILVQIEDASYDLEVANLIVSDYIYAENKPKINSIELNGNKSSADLGLASFEQMSLKEDVINKVTSMSDDVTDKQYFSAKCVKEALADKNLSNLSQIGQTIIDNKANIDLSNLSATGQSVIANKANCDLNNLVNGLANVICSEVPTIVSSASAAIPVVIVENYVNGMSWYRIYSDGWCEQGGFIGFIGSNTTRTMTLLQPYKDTNYNIQLSLLSSNSASSWLWGPYVEYYNRTNSTFDFYDFGAAANMGGYIWHCSGCTR